MKIHRNLIGITFLVLIIWLLNHFGFYQKNLWLDNTKNIQIAKTIHGEKTWRYNDTNTIGQFKNFLLKAPVKYVCGVSRVRPYKITLSNGMKKISYGYLGIGTLTDFKSIGTSTLILKVYDLGPNFENFFESLLKDSSLKKWYEIELSNSSERKKYFQDPEWLLEHQGFRQ